MSGSKGIRREAERYLRSCFHTEKTPRVAELAIRLHMSRQMLNRWFRENYGMTASSYLEARRLRFAERLLRFTSLSTTAIAYTAAFGKRRNLFRTFKKRTGMTPNEYRKRSRM
jgi:AraC-like DNA-binding protein